MSSLKQLATYLCTEAAVTWNVKGVQEKHNQELPTISLSCAKLFDLIFGFGGRGTVRWCEHLAIWLFIQLWTNCNSPVPQTNTQYLSAWMKYPSPCSGDWVLYSLLTAIPHTAATYYSVPCEIKILLKDDSSQRTRGLPKSTWSCTVQHHALPPVTLSVF